MKLHLIIKLTNRAVLAAGQDVKGNQFAIDCELDELPWGARKQIAARLFDDKYVCEGVVSESGIVEPSLDHGQPTLVRVDGTDVKDLIEAVRRDQEEVEEYLAQLASSKDKPAA